MESYILKLYRRGNGEDDQVTGFLVEIDTEDQAAFRSFDELRHLLLDEPNEGKNKRRMQKQT